MIVMDFYNDIRKPINGICEHCKRFNTKPAWCQMCDPRRVVQEKSGDQNIDDCIKEFQLKATAFGNVIEWIPFNKLEHIKMIGKGGFGSVYSSTWLDGKRMVEGDNNLGYVRYRKKSCDVALKTLPGSQTSSSEFLNEFKNHMKCRLKGSALEVYGLTQHTETGQYMMVYQYANRGNLHDFLAKYFRELVWQNKIKQLADISYDLSRIHKAGLIHNDFHSGNILINQNIDGNIISYITDLGLSRKQDEHNSKEAIYGVMPYVAPEILMGQKYTQEADIYSLGVIMAEISTGKWPYDGYKFETKLALKICKGFRPEFANGTPDCYIDLAKQCMDANPQKRLSAEFVNSKFIQWKIILESENLSDEELDIKKKFIDADNIIKAISLKSLTMIQNKYCSTLIDVQKITKNIRVSTQFGHSISKQFGSSTLELPDNINDLN
ncbi:kinase-like domain-containing protein [Gigaspora rosea]|uniref:Kinase-like domain-containing protein n=1 Tax=Gigaspora rosea TaxID=44941 RepID=A0A397TUM7_9GLOM|nr:kinase-like domain-containing protein [Gigaspora rosea]